MTAGCVSSSRLLDPCGLGFRVLIPTFVWFCVECPVTQHVSVITKLVLGSVGEGLGRIQVPGSTVGFGTTRLASSCSPSLLPSLSLSQISVTVLHIFIFSRSVEPMSAAWCSDSEPEPWEKRDHALEFRGLLGRSPTICLTAFKVLCDEFRNVVAFSHAQVAQLALVQ